MSDIGNTSLNLPTAKSQTPNITQTSNSEGEHGATQMDIETESSKSKRKIVESRSEAWENFKKVKVSVSKASGGNTTVEKAQCNFCGKLLSIGSKKYGTSGIRYHGDHCKKNPAKVQKTILTFTAREGHPEGEAVGVFKNWNFNQAAVRKALNQMIITDELPFRFVEHAGFKHFIRVACPQFSIPSRWTMGRDCYMMYDEEMLKLKAVLKKSAKRVCLTTDTWTSVQRVNYLCLTAHFIDENWNLQKRILNFIPISSHRGEDIGMAVEECLAAWGIENVFTITMDNASSNNTAVGYLRRKLTLRNGCIQDGKYLHMRCIAHIINLVVVDGLKSLKDSISRIRNAVRYVRQSPSRWEKFKECIAIEKISSKSSVCLDVRTRWNSTYLMLEAAVKFETAFDRLDYLDPMFKIELDQKSCQTDDDNDDGCGVPCRSDWENARRFVGFLRHFYTLTVRISGSKYVTSNICFSEISGVLYLLEDWQQDKDKKLVDMAIQMKGKYDKYWGKVEKMNMIIYIAAILDPRYKLEYVSWTLSLFYKSEDKKAEMDKLIETVKNALYDMFNEYMRISDHGVSGRKEGTASSSEIMDVSSSSSVAEGSSKLASLYMKHKSKTHNDENKTELDTYLNEATENLSAESEFDILGWWKLHSPRFPILSQMARDVLAVPISIVASESTFSTSGRILDAFRSSLTPRLVQGLICAQDWIRCRTSQTNVSVEEDLAEIEKLDEDVMNMKISINPAEVNID